MAITLKHATVPKEQVQDVFANICHHLCIGHEVCEGLAPADLGVHMHAYLQLKERSRALDIYRLVRDKFRDQYHGLPEVWKLNECSFTEFKHKKENMDAIYWIRYCKKDGKYFEYGEPYDDSHELFYSHAYQHDEAADAEVRPASETEGGSPDDDTPPSQGVRYFV
eukprot:5655067-Karenia_brevis.AAC.1